MRTSPPKKKTDQARGGKKGAPPSSRTASKAKGSQNARAESGQTDGPWIAEMQKARDGRHLGWIINTASSRGGRIGWVDRAFADTNDNAGVDHPENNANAQLIAAAPDLLIALRRIREMSGDPVVENICDAAITKAEGKG